MKKKILAVFTAGALIASLFTVMLNAAAVTNESEAYAVANPLIQYESLSDEKLLYENKLSNFTAAFDYTANDAASSLSLKYDYDSSLKKSVVKEDFEGYKVGDAAYKGSVAAQEGHGNALRLGYWEANAAEIYSGGDYEATFYMNAKNRQYIRLEIAVKQNVKFVIRGYSFGDDPELLGLYTTSVTPLQAPDSNDLIASFKDSDYQFVDKEWYYKIKVGKNTVQLYVNTVNDFDGVEPIINATLPDGLASDNSMLKFYCSNVNVYLDDITVTDLTKSGYESVTTETRTYKELYKNDYEADSAVAPAGANIVDNNGDKMLNINSANTTATIIESVSGDFFTTFYAQTNNKDWDRLLYRIRGDYYLQFRGIKTITGATAYTIGISNSDPYSGVTWYTKKTVAINPTGGCYVKFEVVGKEIKVWYVPVSEWTGEFSDTPTLSYTTTESFTGPTPFTWYTKDASSKILFDDVVMYDLNDYESDIQTVHTGHYGRVELSNTSVTVFKVDGTTAEAVKSAELELNVGQKYRVVVSRDRAKLKVSVDGETVLETDVRYDGSNFSGEVAVSVNNADVSNVDVYDSGRITFDERGAVLTPYKLSEEITALTKSSDKNKVTQNGNELVLTFGSSQNNSSICTTSLFEEELGDFALDFYIKNTRKDFLEDKILFGVSSDISDDNNADTQFSPWPLLMSGYDITFGVRAEGTNYYSANRVVAGAVGSITQRTEPFEFFWNKDSGHIRIVRKGDTTKIYMAYTGDELTLIDEVKTSDYVLGNIHWYHKQAKSSLMGIKAYDTVNRTEYPEGDDNKPTELIAFYSTTKTDKDILIEESKAVYEKVGPWYTFTNVENNNMYLKESLTGDVKLTDMDMSFEYMGSGHWLRNTFYFASSDKYGTTSYSLVIRGIGQAGMDSNGYNIVLNRIVYGRTVQMDGTNIPDIVRGSYKFHITINDGKISVAVKPKNAPDSEAVILKGDDGGFDISGGVYLHNYDAGIEYIRDIVIYNGTDTENAEKPDTKNDKKVIFSSDFDDASNLGIKEFKNEENGSVIAHNSMTSKLQFNTNGSNALQLAVPEGDDWLEDMTIQFDYTAHKAIWNKNIFRWHCERKNGDSFSSVYLQILGSKTSASAGKDDDEAVKGSNVRLNVKIGGVDKCIGWVSIPDVNGREYSFRITQEGGHIKVWAWLAGEQMPAEPVITADVYDSRVCYGGLFIYSWDGNFSIDNLEVLNYPNYEIPQLPSYLDIPVGEIFRVDRIYRTVEEEKSDDSTDEQPVIEEGNTWSKWALVLTVAGGTLVVAAGVVVLIILIKKRKQKA